ncbi:hypothetical protein [Bacillus cereus]|uniref:hypothetical protein n=1 Tax=Bacillus cereus TaxID=1396 RepID=UPI003820FD65
MNHKEKQQSTKIGEYSREELVKLNEDVLCYAKAINGLPTDHNDSLQKRGWLLPFLFGYDSLLWKRWDYWFDIINAGTILSAGPIPQIEWVTSNNKGFETTIKMLQKCLDYHEASMSTFIQWLHWGLALTKTSPKITEKLSQHYYKHFNIFLMQKYPSDYMSIILCEQTGKGYKEGLGYFPTPFQLSIMMTYVVYKDINNPLKREEYKQKTVYDPCVGCGSTFLPASNYSLKGFAQDVSRTALDLLKIQCMLYAPWFAFHPEHIQGFENKSLMSNEKQLGFIF